MSFFPSIEEERDSARYRADVAERAAATATARVAELEKQLAEKEERIAAPIERKKALKALLKSMVGRGDEHRARADAAESALAKLRAEPLYVAGRLEGREEAAIFCDKEAEGRFPGSSTQLYASSIARSIRALPAPSAAPPRCCSSSHEPPDTACKVFLAGRSGRCTYCDHEAKCHPGPGATCEIGSGEYAAPAEAQRDRLLLLRALLSGAAKACAPTCLVISGRHVGVEIDADGKIVLTPELRDALTKAVQ